MGIQIVVAAKLDQCGRAYCLNNNRDKSDADQISLGDRDIAGEIDCEVGAPVAVGITLQRGNAGGAVIEIIEFARRTVEGRGRDELELIVTAGATNRVVATEVDTVRPGNEVGDAVVLAARGRTIAEQENEGVPAAAAAQIVDAGAADQLVATVAADQRIIAAATR